MEWCACRHLLSFTDGSFKSACMLLRLASSSFSAVFSQCAYPVLQSKLRRQYSAALTRWIYSSTLAYIVDSNAGRSSSAVATNSLFRGLFAFAAAEVAVPLQVGYCLDLCHSKLVFCLSHVGSHRERLVVHTVGRAHDVDQCLDSCGVVERAKLA